MQSQNPGAEQEELSFGVTASPSSLSRWISQNPMKIYGLLDIAGDLFMRQSGVEASLLREMAGSFGFAASLTLVLWAGGYERCDPGEQDTRHASRSWLQKMVLPHKYPLKVGFLLSMMQMVFMIASGEGLTQNHGFSGFLEAASGILFAVGLAIGLIDENSAGQRSGAVSFVFRNPLKITEFCFWLAVASYLAFAVLTQDMLAGSSALLYLGSTVALKLENRRRNKLQTLTPVEMIEVFVEDANEPLPSPVAAG